MVDLSIDSFKAKLVGGGARANLFRVTQNFPAFAQGDVELTSYMINSASFPASITNPVRVAFRGRELPLEGDRTYEPITLNIYNDVNHPVREAYLRWKNGISQHSSNQGLSNPADYMVDMVVEQLDKEGNVTVRYDILGAFPSNVGTIELSNAQASEIETFDVTLEYIQWQINGVTQ